MENKCAYINGIKIYPFASFDDLLTFTLAKKGILIALNAEKIMHASNTMVQMINRNIGYCDGVGALFAMKRLGYSETIRIPGCLLWLRIVENLVPKQKSFYLVGGTQEVIVATVKKLKSDFPNVRIVNFHNGYLIDDNDKNSLLNDIAEKKPDVVFVAMGSPKQEILMEEMMTRHSALYQGLGGSFDVYVGRVKRAPERWQKLGLEWLYRLIKQPNRIKRQICYVPFAFKVLFKKL